VRTLFSDIRYFNGTGTLKCYTYAIIMMLVMRIIPYTVSAFHVKTKHSRYI